jgi:hypothetical protein
MIHWQRLRWQQVSKWRERHDVGIDFSGAAATSDLSFTVQILSLALKVMLVYPVYN